MARLAFFGTPDFSIPALERTFAYCQQFSHELCLVVCQPDQPQGRGQHMAAPPIKKWALQHDLPIAQPTTLKKNTKDGDDFYQLFKSLNVDLAIVIAYGRIISARLLGAAHSGFINVHASLLPRFRGAAPIQRAIEAGDKETGVCLMDMVLGLDEGDTFACAKTPIMSGDTSATLFHRLSHLGGSLLFNHLDDLLHKRLPKRPQSDNGIIYAHMLTKEEGLLNFSLSGLTLKNQIQAFDPWPGAYGFVRKKRIKFFDSFFIANDHIKKDVKPGTVVAVKPFLAIKTIDGILYFQSIQIEGKKILPTKDALLGFPIEVGDVIA